MATPGSSFTPMPLGHEDNLEVRHHPPANAFQPLWEACSKGDVRKAKQLINHLGRETELIINSTPNGCSTLLFKCCKKNGRKIVLRMPSTYRWVVSRPLMTTKGAPGCQKKWHPGHNPLLRACVACNRESRIITLPWPSPDTSSMVVRTQMEAGFVTKHYTSPVRMIPT
ncbi:hypothetical protein TNCV_1524431 [Trichonephila clavipes]|nr:hypothetical protein TNCV_1524431 [Trichonephila clavipes]